MTASKILVDGKEYEIVKIACQGSELSDVVSYVAYYKNYLKKPNEIKLVFYNPYTNEWSTTTNETVNVEIPKENVYA